MGNTDPLIAAMSSRCKAMIGGERNGRPTASWKYRGRKRTAPVFTCEVGELRIQGQSSTWHGKFRNNSGVVIDKSTGGGEG